MIVVLGGLACGLFKRKHSLFKLYKNTSYLLFIEDGN